MSEFFNRQLFTIDGLTFTVGVALIALIVIWFLFFRK